MNPKLKYVFCNSQTSGTSGEVPVTAIDEQGRVLTGTIHAQTLNNWIAREANLTPVNIGGSGTEETRQAKVG